MNPRNFNNFATNPPLIKKKIPFPTPPPPPPPREGKLGKQAQSKIKKCKVLKMPEIE